MQRVLNRFYIFLAVNVLVALLGQAVYSLIYKMGGLGYLLPFVASSIIVAFSAIFADSGKFQAFKDLFFSTCITGYSLIIILGNALFYNSDEFLYAADGSSSESIKKAKTYFYTQMHLDSAVLDLPHVGCAVSKIGGKGTDISAAVPLPLSSDTIQRTTTIYIQTEPIKLAYIRCTDLPMEEQKAFLAKIKETIAHSTFFKVLGSSKFPITGTRKSALDNLMRWNSSTRSINIPDMLILEAADFDPLWWRGFWRITLVVVVVMFAVLLLRLIPKIVR